VQGVNNQRLYFFLVFGYDNSMQIPCYPDFTPLDFALKTEIEILLSPLTDGVSEFTFADLYLFRNRYKYSVSANPSDKSLIISSKIDDKSFFMTPCAIPDENVLINLFHDHNYWKNISDSLFLPNEEMLKNLGLVISEDRDNFDYLYLRSDLAELPGKKYHKKRNLVNAFLNSYSYEIKPLTEELIPQALNVLKIWQENKNDTGDFLSAKEALERFSDLNMQGALYYVNGRPAGWCLGEILSNKEMFAIHFEKGIEEYKGIYQFINQTFAASLPENFIYINREQDLGDEGLRQAKMTYRPSGFVKKYRGYLE